MKVEFFPKATRLLQNKQSMIPVDYMSYSFLLPTIGIRPPYYTQPKYQPYYPVI